MTQCQFCGKLFKPQGIKSHEAHCRTRQIREQQQLDATKQYERDLKQVEELRAASFTAAHATVHTSTSSEVGPSQPVYVHDNSDHDFLNRKILLARTCGSLMEILPHEASQEEFGQCAFPAMARDTQPWCPFIEEGDYTFAEIALQAGLSASHINGLLMLITCINQGKAKFTHHNVVAPYKGGDFTFPVYAQSLWDWALDLLSNPLLAPHFTWDAQRLFKYNGSKYERFYSEPWTGDRWWNIQCGNLPINIQNGECYGGRCVVGWLPIVLESAKEEGKTGYTNYKCIIWHEAFHFILDKVTELSKIGYKYECYDKIT
ncbi:hypothetical protein BKA83DRAFT_4523337 [Pisolithus microcarpus]|nr:hypothetical protein BKA83DRAFT_4523337 [Pisolithus microcarpus]